MFSLDWRPSTTQHAAKSGLTKTDIAGKDTLTSSECLHVITTANQE